MKKIPLTGKHGEGRFALVDDADYDRVMAAGPWCAFKSQKGLTYYAVHTIQHPAKPGKMATQYMHRFLMGLGLGDKRQADHMDLDGLNNQRSSNLRIATQRQNICNVGLLKSNTSGFKGVSFSKSRDKWHSLIQVNGKGKHIGYFDDAEKAHAAYCEAAAHINGAFANTGLPAPYDQAWLACIMYRVRFAYQHSHHLTARAIATLADSMMEPA